MSSLVGRIVTTVGVLVLLHAGYSTNHYAKLIELTDEPEPAIPFDVYVEVSIGFVVALLGVIMLAGKLEPIHVADVVERSYDVLNTRADFARYDHRGQAFAALRAKHGVK